MTRELFFFFKFFYGLFVPISIDVKSLGKNTMNRHTDEIQSVDFVVWTSKFITPE